MPLLIFMVAVFVCFWMYILQTAFFFLYSDFTYDQHDFRSTFYVGTKPQSFCSRTHGILWLLLSSPIFVCFFPWSIDKIRGNGWESIQQFLTIQQNQVAEKKMFYLFLMMTMWVCWSCALIRFCVLQKPKGERLPFSAVCVILIFFYLFTAVHFLVSSRYGFLRHCSLLSVDVQAYDSACVFYRCQQFVARQSLSFLLFLFLLWLNQS